jgi:phosphohistidine swiveling domain-containing protein
MEPLTALIWEAPGPGDWWQVREHVPWAVSRMFGRVFAEPTTGWKLGAARYGLPTGEPRWAMVNNCNYYGPPVPHTPAELAERERVAAETLVGTPWRDEVRRWNDEERPRVVAANRALQAVTLATLDDDELVAHVGITIDNHRTSGSLHFEHTGFDVAAGLLVTEAAAWGIDADALVPLLAGSSPGSAAADAHYRAIGEALDRAGVAATSDPGSLDEIRAAGPEVAAALDAFLDEYGCRPIAGNDLTEPTLAERPELVIAALAARRRREPTPAPEVDPAEAVRALVPPDQRTRFDALLADARLCYALRDDDVGVCWNWPIGLIRLAVLELGRRLGARGAVARPEHLFEAEAAEVPSVVGTGVPDAGELAHRAEQRLRAAALVPPLHLAGGDDPDAPEAQPLPPSVAALAAVRDAIWTVAPHPIAAPLHGVGIGTRRAIGPARLVRQVEDVLLVEPGDVLVAPATTAAFNAVFPLLAAVVTEHGGVLSHCAILSREVGLPAVVGVADVFDHVTDGDLVEVDPAAGSVRVLPSG